MFLATVKLVFHMDTVFMPHDTMEEAGDDREEDVKEHRSQDTALLHPNVYLERLRLEFFREYSGLHPVMQML